MDRTPVESSNVKSIGYEADTNRLEVEFKNGGIYSYFGVGIDTHKALMESNSKGQFLNAHIKTQHRFTKH